MRPMVEVWWVFVMTLTLLFPFCFTNIFWDIRSLCILFDSVRKTFKKKSLSKFTHQSQKSHNVNKFSEYKLTQFWPKLQIEPYHCKALISCLNSLPTCSPYSPYTSHHILQSDFHLSAFPEWERNLSIIQTNETVYTVYSQSNSLFSPVSPQHTSRLVYFHLSTQRETFSTLIMCFIITKLLCKIKQGRYKSRSY